MTTKKERMALLQLDRMPSNFLYANMVAQTSALFAFRRLAGWKFGAAPAPGISDPGATTQVMA